MERLHFATFSALITGVVFAVSVLEAVAVISFVRIGFGLLFRRGQMGLLALPLLIMTGPAIILRETRDMAYEAEHPLLVWFIGLDVAAGWAIASGHVLLRIIGLVAC